MSHVVVEHVRMLSWGIGLMLALGAAARAQQADLPAANEAPSTALQAAAALEEALVRAIADAERSVVAIARVRREDHGPLDLAIDPFNRLTPAPTPRPGDPEFIPNEYATGVVVGAGLVLTANHVLQDDCDYWVTAAGRKTYKVTRVQGTDPRSDLAVLQVEAPDLVPIRFGDASKLKKGQIVIALGNPYAIARDGEPSASWGIVANLSRKLGPWTPERDERSGPARPTLHHYGTLIQTDARLNLGTSGGALLNLQGEMIGLTVSLAAALGYEQPAGFAIPVDETFERAVQSLKQGSEVEYGLLGVTLPLSNDPQARAMQGAVVRNTVPATPAGRSPLAAGDLITEVNGHPVREADDLLLHVGKLPPEASVRLTVEREGQVQTIVIPELAKYPITRKRVVTNPRPAWRGLHVDYVTVSPNLEMLADQRGIDPQGLVLIVKVDADTPAWREGLRPDMTISHVDGQRVTTPGEFRRAVADRDGPVTIRLSPASDERLERTIPPEAG